MSVDVKAFAIYGFGFFDEDYYIIESDEDTVSVDDENKRLYIPYEIFEQYGVELVTDGWNEWQALGVPFVKGSIDDTISALKSADENLRAFCNEVGIDLSKYDVELVVDYVNT